MAEVEAPHYQKDYPEWSRHLQGLNERYVDPMKITVRGRDVMILQENVLRAEDLSLVLSHYFGNTQVFDDNFWPSKRVIELGSGTGIVGAVVSSMGAEVTITDKHPQTELIQRTIDHNEKALKGCRHSVRELLWGQDVSSFGKPYDIIIASECIYYNELVDPLCDSLLRLSDKNTVIYLSYESHNDEPVECFMTAAAVHFNIEKVDVKDHDAVFRTENINIVKLRRKH